MKRRSFLRDISYTTALLPLAPTLGSFFMEPEYEYLTILHTNDVHSRIDPFPEGGGRNAGRGGVARRASLIADIREDKEHVLLLDCGDILQGTPYFNFFDGKLEFQLMDELKYDAATIGNHDFDAGFEILTERCAGSNFEMINSNYNMSNSPLNKHVKPYKIFEKGAIKIGVFGVGISLDGLVPKDLYGDIEVQDPFVTAERMATRLKKDEKCDVVICLSHLGYQYEQREYFSDVAMAGQTRNIDVIIGGHTHTFLKSANQILNKDGDPVIVNQVGWGGIMLGRIDLVLEKNKKNKCYSCKNDFLQNSVDNSIIKYK